jgi:hypothetical protein
MVTIEKLIKTLLPYLMGVAMFFVGKWYAGKTHQAVAVDVAMVKQLHELELNNMRMDYQLRLKTVEVEFMKQREAIDEMSPKQIDSLWSAFGF